MLIIAALSIEVAPLLNDLRAEKVKAYSNKTALFRVEGHHILITGVGPVMSQRTLEAYLDEYRPDLILNIGTAGMLVDHMALGQICHIERTITENEAPIGLYMLIDGPGETCLSLRRSVNDRTLRDRVQVEYNARLADMECYTIAAIAGKRGIPMSAVKITTDFADCGSADMFKTQIEKSAKKLAKEIIGLIKAKEKQ